MEDVLTTPKIRLEPPSLAIYDEFLEFIKDMQSNNQTLWEPYLPKKKWTKCPRILVLKNQIIYNSFIQGTKNANYSVKN